MNADLEMTTGKMVAQACHGAMKVLDRCDNGKIEAWKNQGAKKIVLESNDLEEMESRMRSSDIEYSTVRDAGLTEVESGAFTCIASAPVEENKIDSVTGELNTV